MYAIITVKGGSTYCAAELLELGIKAKSEGIDWCSAELSAEDLERVQLRSQCAVKVLKVIAKASREELGGIATTLKPESTFAVRASGDDRQELQEELGAIIHETSGAPVKLEEPGTLYYCHESAGEYIFGIDVLKDLSRRHYKIMSGSQSLTGPFAACLLRLAGWTPKDNLVVWPCWTGEIAIEAALWASKKSPRAYELKNLSEVSTKCDITAADPKLSMVRSAEKNAKVAGVQKALNFSRQDVDWLDTKHDEAGVQYFLGMLPNLKFYPKLAKELFYHLSYIMKNKGTVVFVCVNEESAVSVESHATDFTVRREYLWLGKQPMTIIFAQKTKTTK